MLVKALNLPPPTNEILKIFRDHENSIELASSRHRWLNDFYDNEINCAAFWFGVVPVLDDLIKAQYQSFFSEPICAGGGIMENWGIPTASQPPHSDAGRKLAINWYIDLGGTDVDTVFYCESSPTKDDATNFKYNQVNELARYRFGPNCWYAYDVDKCHSVEGIQTRRTFLSIVVGNMPSHISLGELTIDSYTVDPV